VLIALAGLVYAGAAISLAAPDMYTKLLAAGFTAFIGFQAVVNIGGVLRVLPMTGITLPFVSHGGWSLITSFAMLGILLAFSHRNSVTRPVVEKAPEFVPVR
jgi:cell division protein FtsW (lipid II flippase)